MWPHSLVNNPLIKHIYFKITFNKLFIPKLELPLHFIYLFTFWNLFITEGIGLLFIGALFNIKLAEPSPTGFCCLPKNCFILLSLFNTSFAFELLI